MNWADYLRVFASWISQSRSMMVEWIKWMEWMNSMEPISGKQKKETDTTLFSSGLCRRFWETIARTFSWTCCETHYQPQLRNTSFAHFFLCVYMSTRIQRWASELFTAAAQTSFVAVPSPAQGWHAQADVHTTSPIPSPRLRTPSISLLLAHAPAKLTDVCTHLLCYWPKPGLRLTNARAHVLCANFLFLKRTPQATFFVKCQFHNFQMSFSFSLNINCFWLLL